MNESNKKLKELLQDNESKEIFDARIEYMRTRDTLAFIEKMHNLYKNFQYYEMDCFLNERDISELSIVIFGAGHEGEIACKILKHTKYASFLYAFCDNKKELWGKEKQGLPILSVYDLMASKKEILYVLASRRYNYEFMIQLLNLCVPQKNIFISPYGGFLFAQRGWQYFDVFQACDSEEFVDGGAYDGMTAKNFMKWCNGKYTQIDMFELNADMKPVCFSNIGTKNKVNFIAKGLWDKNIFLDFCNTQNSSHIIETFEKDIEKTMVQVCSIDSELKNRKITYIKLDVEGSELRALHGGTEIIRKLKPKLAICVYHKLNDMVDIMSYLLELNLDYKFYLRHYSACEWETVLYAI